MILANPQELTQSALSGIGRVREIDVGGNKSAVAIPREDSRAALSVIPIENPRRNWQLRRCLSRKKKKRTVERRNVERDEKREGKKKGRRRERERFARAIVMHVIEKRLASRTIRRAFSIRALSDNEQNEWNLRVVIRSICPAPGRRGRIPPPGSVCAIVQWENNTREEKCRKIRRWPGWKDVDEEERKKGRVASRGRRRKTETGRNNVFILCAWLNVSPLEVSS